MFLKSLVIIVVFGITPFAFIQAQEITQDDDLRGVFYQFANGFIIKVDIQDSIYTESVFLPEYRKDSIIRNKVETKKGKYSYICHSEVPSSFLVSKLKLIENGNYGIYLMNDYKKDFYHSIDEFKQDVERDTTNVQMGMLYCENEFNKFNKLKNISELSKDDFVNMVKNMADDLRQTIYSINADDKVELEEWIGYHGYIQATNLAKNCIKLGYNPIFHYDFFVDLFHHKEYGNALKDANVNFDF